MRVIVAAGGVVMGLVVFVGTVAGVRAEDGPVPAGDSLAALKDRHEKAMARLHERQKRIRTDAEREAAQADVWREIKSTAARAFAWAEAHPDDPEAIDAVVWTIHGLANGYYPEYAQEIRRAYAYLTDKAIASEKVAPVCYYADHCSIACPEALRFLETALNSSPNRLVRGTACLGLARHHHALAHLAGRLNDPITAKPLKERWAKVPAFLEKLPRVDIEAEDHRAEHDYERITAEFGDIKMPYPYNETPFAEKARGELYALRNLAVGKVAPEIAGEDMEGKPIRLADFRGKVVAVVFWATWCGPCMAMVPHERELVKRLTDKPFVLVGVNGDDDRAKARATMAKESMTWPSFWNGGMTGGIVASLGVKSWPTIYVLDARGVIRYTNVRGGTLDQAVDKLVAESSATK